MTPDYIPHSSRERFWNRVYKSTVVALCVFGSVMAVWAVLIAYQVIRQNRDTNQKIDCIALFFNQDRRADKKVSVGEQCKIVPTL